MGTYALPAPVPKTQDSTTIEVPAALRDLIARHRLHPRQALHEVVEEAFRFWEEGGAWSGMSGPWDAARRPHRPSLEAPVPHSL